MKQTALVWLRQDLRFDGNPALRAAAVQLGKDDPKPIVDHAQARRKAMEAYDRIKRGT